jgi:transcriptional regulator with XRE-family HTH domain
MNLFNLPTIDRKDPQQVSDRINLYFTRCCEADIKPSVAGLANALGVQRQAIWDIRSGNDLRGFSPESADLIKKAHGILGELWEDYMQNGKVNPVAGIFLGKNHFGYKDQQEVVVTPNNPLGDETSTEEIAKRIAEDTSDYIEAEFED